MSINTKIRYCIGKSISLAEERLIRSFVMPFGLPYQSGRSLELDLVRILCKQVEHILDVGANVGQTSLRYSRYFPNATIDAFEPVRHTFERLEANTKNLKNVDCHQLAFSNTCEILTIDLTNDSELNSLWNRSAEVTSNTASIETTTLNAWMPTSGISKIDLLKIDTEGFELQVLQGGHDLLESGIVRAVYAECGFARDGRHTNFCELHSYMVALGFYFSGFYEMYRWGKPFKSHIGFGNGLWLYQGRK